MKMVQAMGMETGIGNDARNPCRTFGCGDAGAAHAHLQDIAVTKTAFSTTALTSARTNSHREIFGDDWVVLHRVSHGTIRSMLLMLLAAVARPAAALLPPLGRSRLPQPPAFGRTRLLLLLLLLRGRWQRRRPQRYP